MAERMIEYPSPKAQWPGSAPGRLPASPPAADDILRRALTRSTAGPDEATAARAQEEATTAPAWAARSAYALGYWEGGEDRQALVMDGLAALERRLVAHQPAPARPRWQRARTPGVAATQREEGDSMAQPEPQHEYPPAAPGPNATPWRCRCGNLLGLVYQRWLHTRHRGRAIEASLPARVQCENCGRTEVRTPPDEVAAADRYG